MTPDNTPAPTSIDTALTGVDVVLLDHDDLQAFITTVKNTDHDVQSLTVFTDDDVTRGSTEFNLISTHDDTHRICTQLHHPFSNDDTVLDLRRTTNTSFADYLLGLPQHNTPNNNNNENT